MDEEVISAIIALGGVIVSVLITLLLGIDASRYNYKHLYAETVSESRNKWLNEMRDFISTALSEAVKTKWSYKTKEFYKAKNEIILRLNMKEPLHIMLSSLLDRLDNCTDDDYAEICKNIIIVSQQLLKIEWERVKEEAKGKKGGK